MPSNKHVHKRFPDRLNFLLNNPIRRAISPPNDLISKLAVTQGDVVMDFGCGPGFFTIAFAKIALKTIAIDVSSRMLERTANYAEKNHVHIELLKSDGTTINLADSSVDLVFLSHVFHEVEDKPRVLKEFLRILRPSGRLAIVEKTRGSSIFSGKFGPPIIKEDEVIDETDRAGFRSVQTIPHRKDSMIVCQKLNQKPTS
jgi:ubiquinone/menaquinone biosynthesis C-methylase UbiE